MTIEKGTNCVHLLRLVKSTEPLQKDMRALNLAVILCLLITMFCV